MSKENLLKRIASAQTDAALFNTLIDLKAAFVANEISHEDYRDVVLPAFTGDHGRFAVLFAMSPLEFSRHVVENSAANILVLDFIKRTRGKKNKDSLRANQAESFNSLTAEQQALCTKEVIDYAWPALSNQPKPADQIDQVKDAA
jgi:hypothetical protein